jgi:hypothetical protein
MSTEHLMWATEQSCIAPASKLLAIYLANYAGMDDEMTFRLEDAAAWCGIEIEDVEGCLYELEKECGLGVMRNYNCSDKSDCEATVKIPDAKNGGRLL